MRVRVVTYNVRGFRDGLDRVSGVVAHLAPDVLLLQESGPRRGLRRLGATAGMEVAGDPWSPFRRRVKNAVLVRPPWRIVRHSLHRFADSVRFYPRGALIAQVGRSGRRLWIASVHLGLRREEQLRHVRELTDLCAGLAGGPIVIGGDLNSTPDRPTVRWLAERYRDAWTEAGDGAGPTIPAADPTARIDYVFASAGISVEGATVGDAPDASDHLPVGADLVIQD